MKYILDGDTVTVTKPVGLNISIINIIGSGSVVITDDNGTTTFPGETPLPKDYNTDISIAATGAVSVEVIYVGDQTASRIAEGQPNAAWRKPGKWGN